jgi:hypothetical protein
MSEPQARSPESGRGLPLSSIVALAVFIALTVYFFNLPLRSTAWGGPRGAGPFEEASLPGAGWFAREARLCLENVAATRSPDRVLEATGEALAGYYAVLAVARYILLWVALRRVGAGGLLASLGVVASALPELFGAPRQTESDVGLLLFVTLLVVTIPSCLAWWVAVGALPVLFAIWANAHASVMVGFAWLSVITLGRTVEWWKARKSEGVDSACVVRLAVAIVLCAAAACLNPDGPQLFVDAFKAAKNPNIPTLVDWQPVDFSKPAGMPWFYLATIAALLVTQLLSPRIISPTALLVVLTFGLWPLVQQRGQAYWWLIMPVLLVPQLEPLVERWKTKLSGSPVLLPHWARWIAVGAIAAATISTPAVWWLITGRPRSLEGIVSEDTPWRVAREFTAEGDNVGRYLPDLRTSVQAAYPNGRYRGAILCDESQGDFLAWVLDGDNSQPVMLYTRPEALDPPHWAEAHRALEGQGDWWEILGRHQVNLVVIDPGKWGKLAERLRGSEAWRTFQDGILLVAVRREPKLPADMQHP